MATQNCDQALLLQAEFDGELDIAQSAALAQHRAGCTVCEARWAELAALRTALKALPYHRASPALTRAIAARVAPAVATPLPRPRRPWWREAASFGIGAALAASLLLMLRPAGDEGLVAALVDDHVRALQPGHWTDVVSTDRHTVKPWFDGKLDFAPPVKDLVADGFPLRGGRLDYLGGRAVAALAYEHGNHPIDLFVWPERGAPPPPATARHGYNLVHWSADGMTLWAVSDVERDQLEDFARLWQKAP
jgi:anti-sigma factor RsiW